MNHFADPSCKRIVELEICNKVWIPRSGLNKSMSARKTSTAVEKTLRLYKRRGTRPTVSTRPLRLFASARWNTNLRPSSPPLHPSSPSLQRISSPSLPRPPVQIKPSSLDISRRPHNSTPAKLSPVFARSLSKSLRYRRCSTTIRSTVWPWRVEEDHPEDRAAFSSRRQDRRRIPATPASLHSASLRPASLDNRRSTPATTSPFRKFPLEIPADAPIRLPNALDRYQLREESPHHIR